MARLSDVANAGSVLPKFESFLYGSYNAVDYLFSAPTGGELETWLGTQMNLDAFRSVLESPEGVGMIARSSDSMTAIANSSTAMSELVGNGKAMAAMVRESAAIDAFVAVSSAMTAIAGSTTAMQAVADSQDALNGLTGTQTAAQTLGNSTTAVDAIVADKYAWPIFMSNDDAAAAVASNDTVMGSLISSGDGLDAVFSNASAVASIGSDGAVYDAIKVDDTAIAKFLAGAAGLEPSRIGSMSDLLTSVYLMRDVWMTPAATDALWASAVASNAFWAANTQGQTLPVYTDGNDSNYVDEGSSFVKMDTDAFNGGSRLNATLTETASSGTSRYIKLSYEFDVTGVNTVYVSTLINLNGAYYQSAYVYVIHGGTNEIYYDGNDTGSDVYGEDSIDVSNMDGVITLSMRVSLEYDTGASPQPEIFFGNIRME